MKKIITLAAILAASLALFSCRTLKDIPEDKTPAQIIQMGQNYVGNGDYKSAEFCYKTVIERYGSDPAIYVEGRYELSFSNFTTAAMLRCCRALTKSSATSA